MMKFHPYHRGYSFNI